MYHCHLHIYFIGDSQEAFGTIRHMPPLEHFTHEFWESVQPQEALLARADAVFASLAGADAESLLPLLAAAKRPDAPLILFAESGQLDAAKTDLSAVADIWPLPLSAAETQFRFLRWQQTCQQSKDFWLTAQYLDATINGSPNLIWYKDQYGIHKKVNDSFCRTVKKTKQQVEGRDHYYIWDVDPSLDSVDCMESDRIVMEKKCTCMSEETVQTGEGVRLMTTYKSPLYDVDGTVMGTVGIGIDVTQERAYEQELITKNLTLEKLFATIDCGVLRHTIDGTRILSVNKTALDILGYRSQEEMMASGFQMIADSVLDEDKEKLRQTIESLQHDGDSASIEYRVLHSDGEILHVMGNVKLLSENGERYYQRFLLDCTAQKQEERMREKYQTELVQALSIDYTQVFVFDLDTGTGQHLRTDETTLRRLDTHLGEELSFTMSMEQYIQVFVYEEDRDMLRQCLLPEQILQALAEKQYFSVNYRVFLDDTIRYWEMKLVRTGEWTQKHRIVLGFRSVDEEVRSEQEQKRRLEDALVQAQSASRAKTAFLSNMSHDIRTPMNAIIGFTGLALSHIGETKQVNEYLQKISTAGRHMMNLLNDVLDMSHIESGKVHLEETPCRLPDLLRELTSIVQADIDAKKLDFQIILPDLPMREVFCDRQRLNRVLLNVLSNSIKYTQPEGSISLLAKELPGSQDQIWCEFRIRDNGSGMSKEFLAHIFDSFSRERNTTFSGIQGTGLGMAITRNLVELMHGSIQVESEQGVGTEVTIRLPFRPSFAPEPEAAPAGISGESDAPEAFLTGKRILLTEDNELNREIAIVILEDAGALVETAENGQIAVDMVEHSAPGYYNLVLMDIQMPVMDGYTAARTIRRLENKELASIPILAMTANAFHEDEREARAAGMNGHIAKPIDTNLLFEAVLRILSEKEESGRGYES